MSHSRTQMKWKHWAEVTVTSHTHTSSPPDHIIISSSDWVLQQNHIEVEPTFETHVFFHSSGEWVKFSLMCFRVSDVSPEILTKQSNLWWNSSKALKETSALGLISHLISFEIFLSYNMSCHEHLSEFFRSRKCKSLKTDSHTGLIKSFVTVSVCFGGFNSWCSWWYHYSLAFWILFNSNSWSSFQIL